MLSICIPVFNKNVTGLISTLADQANKAGINYEILAIDDDSDAICKEQNKELTNLESVIYYELPDNVGRAKIRNLLAERAQYEYILFLDCDVVLIDDNFIKNYISAISSEKPSVICGGRVYPDAKPEKKKLLRWNYGHKYESQPAEIRKMHPNKSFMTNNFIIKKEVIISFPFNENLTGYGHEDTLLGFELKQNKIEIKHIENPVLNGDIEENKEFITKTITGIKNLAFVTKMLEFNPGFINDIRLIKTYYKLKKYKLHYFLMVISFLFSGIIKFFLTSFWFKPQLFNFYKLLIYTKYS